MELITEIYVSGELSAMFIYPEDSEVIPDYIKQTKEYLRQAPYNKGKHITVETRQYEKE
jgi:hypothetical protein